MIILLNLLYINGNYYNTNFSETILPKNEENNQDIPLTTAGTSLQENPFTKNFDLVRNFFEKNYKSSLDYSISTYYRYGDSNGVITDDTIYSEDNLFYYKTLMKTEINPTETFDKYLKLKETPLWYEGNYSQFEYGFVKSIDNTTDQIKDENRYLIDNLLPIFLLIENIGDGIGIITINGKTPIESINEMFYLINSSEFWDDNDKGFYNLNSTTPTDKYTESNFYSVLANLLIHRTPSLDNSIRDRAYELANQTMIALDNFMWDNNDKAFIYFADFDWTSGSGPQNDLHLSVNSIGIIALLEFWIETGMENDSVYLQKAIQVYNSLDIYLYNDSISLYRNIAQPTWIPLDNSLNLESNAMMMSACLKLFEVTGNITYYERAVNLSKSFDTNLYDNLNNAYNFSFTNSSKSFHSNLMLSEAYLDAFDIYNSTVLDAVYNVSNEVPNFIFNQDVMNLTSIYSFKRTRDYFDPESTSFLPFTVQYNISSADINYLFKYPNGTYIEQFEYQINITTASHTLIYPIKESLPIGDGYNVYVWANTTYFRMAESIKHFNVISGLINKTIEGLVGTLYQGPIINVSLVINYTRSDNLTLTASLEGEDIKNYPSQEINFTAFEEVRISFNLTAKVGVIPGDTEIFFKIKQGNIFYLEIKRVIEIGYSFDYNNFIYQSKVVNGDNIFVSMNLKNFLPNATQSLNISFTGITPNCIEDFKKEEMLSENEIKTVSYNLKSSESIANNTIRIKMSILINITEYYSEIFKVEIKPKYELISVSFPKSIPQGTFAYLIIIIQNNQENSEEISLYVNGERVGTNIAELNTGENRILAQIMPTINPYEFGVKKYRIVLKDSTDEEIERFYFEVTLELSTLNLVIFYILPIIVPIGIILYFKNKDIKHKKLRR